MILQSRPTAGRPDAPDPYFCTSAVLSGIAPRSEHATLSDDTSPSVGSAGKYHLERNSVFLRNIPGTFLGPWGFTPDPGVSPRTLVFVELGAGSVRVKAPLRLPMNQLTALP